MDNFTDLEPGQLADYLAGEASPEVRGSIERWAAASPERSAWLDDLRRGWQAVAEDDSAVPLDLDAFCAGVAERIAAPAIAAPRLTRRGTRWYSRVPLAAAAVVAVAVAIAGVRTLWVTGGDAPPTAYAIHKTGDGQIARITLADGSRVTLAPNSAFGVSRTFDRVRDVTLSGEAYFEVAASSHAPFLVHTGAVTTRVLGTAFDVKRYPADRAVRVAVASGKVAVDGRQSVTLTAGNVGHVTDSTAVAVAASNVDALTGWTTGTLVFRQAPVSDMLDAVAHWYNLEFRVADSALLQQTVTATFVNGQTRADALALVRTGLNVTMTFDETRDGKVIVTLHEKSRASRNGAPTRHGLRDSLLPTMTEVGR